MKLSDLIIDPEFYGLLDIGRTPEEIAATRGSLCENIIEEGRIRDPITVWLGRNIVVDGQTRLSIFNNELKKDPQYEPEIIAKKFKDRDAVKRWMRKYQCDRRNLNASQLAMHGAAMEGMTIEEAAAKFGVSTRLVSMARNVTEHGTSQLQEAVNNGQVTVSDANNIAQEPKAVQVAAVKAVKKKVAKTVTSAVRAAKKKPKNDGAETREPGDETNPESNVLNKLSDRLTKETDKALKTLGELIRAIDAKSNASKPFSNRHKKFMGMAGSLKNLIEPAKTQAAAFQKSWGETRKQVDE